MKGGYTGTAQGMTTPQVLAFRNWLISEGITELHAGDCVGGDLQAAACADALGIRVIGHPPTVPTWRAYFRRYAAMRPPAPFMVRNQHIVAEANVMFGAPRGPERSLPRSGTWATIRRARAARRPLTIVMPDGSTTRK